MTQRNVRVLTGAQASFTNEARSIQFAAQRGETRLVKLGPIVFFSSSGGDAWMLDPEDQSAVCLARDHVPRPIPIQETDSKLLIEWNADYSIQGETFTYTERNSPSVRTVVGYPTAEIEQMVRDYPASPLADLSAGEAAFARLKTGRNDPCPCGSGRKYKKCCLASDEALERKAIAARQDSKLERIELGPEIPYAEPDPELEDEMFEPEVELAPEVHDQLDELWDEFDETVHPTAQQMDTLLAGLLNLPPEATDWNDLFHRFADYDYPDLEGLFRRIAGTVPHTKATEMGFFYWGAAEVFLRRQALCTLPEVAAGFCRLDAESYDPDALAHIEDWLLATGYPAEALGLAEHFLPILRADEEIMSWAIPLHCHRIFDLRVGRALRERLRDDQSPAELAEALRRDITEEIHPDMAGLAARIVSGQEPNSEWKREQLNLPVGDFAEEAVWHEHLRLQSALTRMAQEAWQVETFAPECAVVSLGLVYEAVAVQRRKSKKAGPPNLLDFLRPAGLEQRIIKNCPEMVGVNEARSRLVLQGLRILFAAANRHQLLSPAEVEPIREELERLCRKVDDMGWWRD